VRGHPAGKTVLSYFPVKVDGLLPLDKVMLHAWYSPKMRGGMTPFEAMPVLGEELAKTMPDPDQALQDRDRFLAQIVDQSEQFADGQGDVPMIIKRSGKATIDGIRFGRREMSYFLGVAFLEGKSVPQDATMAVKWLQQAANMGSRTAQARLGAATAR
jgi:TPR repeat protein